MTLEELIDRLSFGKLLCENYYDIIKDFRRNYPDVEITLEHSYRPCPYYMFSVDKFGVRRAVFFRGMGSLLVYEKKLKTWPEIERMAGSKLSEWKEPGLQFTL